MPPSKVFSLKSTLSVLNETSYGRPLLNFFCWNKFNWASIDLTLVDIIIKTLLVRRWWYFDSFYLNLVAISRNLHCTLHDVNNCHWKGYSSQSNYVKLYRLILYIHALKCPRHFTFLFFVELELFTSASQLR